MLSKYRQVSAEVQQVMQKSGRAPEEIRQTLAEEAKRERNRTCLYRVR